jgi:hypothetical protein
MAGLLLSQGQTLFAACQAITHTRALNSADGKAPSNLLVHTFCTWSAEKAKNSFAAANLILSKKNLLILFC